MQHRSAMVGLTAGCLALLFALGACTGGTDERPAADTGSAPDDDPTPTTTSDAASAEAAAEATTETGADDGSPVYRDSSQPIEARVDDLLARMTLDDKLGQMTLVENGSITPEQAAELGIGAILSGGDGGPERGNGPEKWTELVAGYQEAAQGTELGVPVLYGIDAVHGHNNVSGATIFPHNIGLGAAGDAQLVTEIGRATAIETLATGIHWNFAPVVAVPQDVRWGRTYEAYGERTDLVTELSTAYLLGLQGVDGETDVGHPLTMMGTPKHFVADGGTGWGTSTTGDFSIDQGDAVITEDELRRVHLPPYPAAVEAGAMSVMASFSSWNGTKMHAERYLLTDVLKGELGFEGFVVSDWQAIDQISPDYYASVVEAVNAGIDMNMVPSNHERFLVAMQRGVAEGAITEDRIDDAVGRILNAKFRLGLFERPLADPELAAAVGSDEHRALARRAVRESLVLLQNRNGVLPLSKDLDTVFVAGIGADDLALQSGGWTIGWQGMGNAQPPGTTIVEAIENAVGPSTDVEFDRFGKFERRVDEAGAPLRAEVGIVVVAEQPYAEGRGDSDDLTINTDMIERVAARVDSVVVILLSGRPMVITDGLAEADVWVAAWLPGTEGDGVADVLFGDHPFRGATTFTWPRSMAQLPFDFDGLPGDGCDAPLFPYGYGLSVADTEPVLVPAC